MKILFTFWCVLFLYTPQKFADITLAITGCNVITMNSEGVLKNQTILISQDKIVAILPADQWGNKQDIETIDGRGRYVIPALTDMHIHVNKYSDWMFPLLLLYGVTTIRVMGGSEAVLNWRDSVNNDLKLAPEIHCASQVIDGQPPFWGDLHEGPILTEVDSVAQVINAQLTKGYEFIKAYNRLDKDVYAEIRKVCFNNNIKLTGHIPTSVNKEDIFTGETGEIEHLSGYARYASNIDSVSKEALAKNSDMTHDHELAQNVSLAKMKSAAEKTRRFNIWNCPTLIVHGIKTDSIFCRQLLNTKLAGKLAPVSGWWKSQGYKIKPGDDKLWQFKKAMTKQLHQQKAFLLAGTDSPVPWVVPGLSMHQELAFLVEAGLSNYYALKTATVNPSIWFGNLYNKGTIEKGKAADLIILSANPLENIRNTQKIVQVIYKGKLFRRAIK
ncbi:MAG: amidohydrolase family protein [Chitinophagaceae bacterium]|nr:amidohydrolase family protein [Chitinophagaceae bacterium]